MKPVAIHKYYEDVWTDGWIKYCAENGVPYEVINGFNDGIIRELPNYSALFWNFNPWRYEDLQFARHILLAAEQAGLRTYPDHKTCWTYDDKVAQKYILEAVGAPLIPTHVFYELEKALEFVGRSPLPLVGKLRHGAAANNVVLLKTKGEAEAYCRRMFGKGIDPAPKLFADMGVRIAKAKKLKSAKDLLAAFTKLAAKVASSRRNSQIERGYVLLQDFMPGNEHDIRIFVIGDRAWGFTRFMREGDFRASGSGNFGYDRSRMPVEVVKAAFECTEKLGAKAMGYDFLKDAQGKYRIIEMSCGSFDKPLYLCPGQWDRDLNWHEGNKWPQVEILKLVLSDGTRK